jgi:proteasome lid subunit RPN8/RPN11
VSDQRRELVLNAAARATISAESSRSMPFETGGILLGYREDRCIVVTDALVVTALAASPNRYVRDDVQANEQLRRYLATRAPDDPIGYVGEWHSHPCPRGPSSIDIKAIRATANESSGPIALVVCSPRRDPEFSAVIAAQQPPRQVSVKEIAMEPHDQDGMPIGPLPAGAVRGDGPVFISYRQSDGSDRADSLEGLLRAAGLVVWRDHSDLRAGTTIDRLEQALTAGLSAAVLVVTPEIAKSDIVKERELPRLLQLDQDPAFSLSVANEIPDPAKPDRPDYAAPDLLLSLAPAHTLGDKKQSNTRTQEGRLEIVRDLLMHRIEQRRAGIAANDGVLTMTTQTRPAPSALDADKSDLHIRIKPADVGRLPSAQGLHDLQATLRLTSDAVRASGASTVRISGGMHLSVALAVGAALPETKIGHVEVIDLRDGTWTSKASNDPNQHLIVTETINGDFGVVGKAPSKIAVFVTLTGSADKTSFDRLVAEHAGLFSSVSCIRLAAEDSIDPREAARLSAEVAAEIKRLSAQFGRAEVHLAYHGPYTMAVLIGRLLNTLRTVVYEWDNPEEFGPKYIPTLTLEPGVAQGPLTNVLL